MRNVCTEAGMFAIRDDRDYVVEEDFTKAARKIAEGKKLETKLEYTKV
jgi:26S proteasome regulatory subunit T4